MTLHLTKTFFTIYPLILDTTQDMFQDVGLLQQQCPHYNLSLGFGHRPGPDFMGLT